MNKIAFFLLAVISIQAKIYDCFPFFNELELLDIRLNELYNYVDKFVLVEWTETHRGNPKPLYYEENKERYHKFSDKIIHIVLTEHIEAENPWTRENFQRQQIMRGLSECQPDDIVMISDLDEIVRATSLSSIVRLLQVEKKEAIGCAQTMYRFFLNVRDPAIWYGTVVTTYGYIMNGHSNLTQVRLAHQWTKSYPIVPNSGWHFTWMGGLDRVIQKMESFAHRECDLPENKSAKFFKDQLKEYNSEVVRIDNSYPQYVIKNIQYFLQIGWISK